MTDATTLYSWKICSPDQPDAESIGTLADLEQYLDQSDLEGAHPSRKIIARTLSMQLDGQGYFKSSADPESRWTLTWLELASSAPAWRGSRR